MTSTNPTTFSHHFLNSVTGKRTSPYSDTAPYWLICKYRPFLPGLLFSLRSASSSPRSSFVNSSLTGSSFQPQLTIYQSGTPAEYHAYGSLECAVHTCTICDCLPATSTQFVGSLITATLHRLGRLQCQSCSESRSTRPKTSSASFPVPCNINCKNSFIPV